MDRLIVKNFGPLKDVDIELNKINLFIGENGSGKSVLGKIVTIVKDFTHSDKIEILEKFRDYNIDFLTNETVIQLFEDESLLFKIENYEIFAFLLDKKKQKKEEENNKNLVVGNSKISDEMKDFFSKEENLESIKPILEELSKSYHTVEKQLNPIFEDLMKKLSTIDIEGFKQQYKAQYIPAERNLISLFNKYVTTFITADIPLPKFLLNFSSQYVRAREEIRELNLLNVKYKFESDQERIFYNDEEFLLLEKSSSGIQSALPLYLAVKYFAKKHKSIIIEEPEQNLFPKAQKETVEYIVEQMSDDNSLFMMTHSPYVLTALNNLILANDVKTQKGVEAIEGIVKKEQCVAFEDVSAYSLVDGKSISIIDKEDRLIGVNLIDSISDEVSDTFDKLLAKLD